jgi:hypothetical protein
LPAFPLNSHQLDTDHNGQDAVYLNVFLNFAHTALKIHYYELDERKWQLVYQWLCLAVEYTYSAGRARVRHATRTLDNCDREHFAVPQKIFS